MKRFGLFAAVLAGLGVAMTPPGHTRLPRKRRPEDFEPPPYSKPAQPFKRRGKESKRTRGRGKR